MHRCALTLALVALACEEPAPPPAVAPPPAAAPAPPRPRPERFTLRAGASVELDGRPFVFTGVLEPSEHVASGRAGLERGGAYLAVPLDGCTRDGDHAYRVERAVAGRGSWARFARMRADRAIERPYGEEAIPLGMLEVVRTTDGWTLAIATIDVRADGSWMITLEARHGDRREQPYLYLLRGREQAGGTLTFGRDRYLTLRPQEERDALGCVTFTAILENPEEQIVEVDPGQIVALRPGARARVGAFTVRFREVGEQIVVGGGHRAFVRLELSDGAHVEPRHTDLPGTAAWAGHLVEVVGYDGGRVQLRVRRAE